MASVASHDTGVVPTRNWEPDFGVQVTLTGAVPPLDVGLANVTFAFPLLPGAVTGAIVGHARVNGGGAGAVGGGRGDADTTTTDAHEAFCFNASIAVQVKEVLPTAKSEPDAGEHAVVIGWTPPLAVGVSVTDMDFPSGDVKTGDGHETATGWGASGVRPATSDVPGPTSPVLSYDCTIK